jgi:hypothetical protein
VVVSTVRAAVARTAALTIFAAGLSPVRAQTHAGPDTTSIPRAGATIRAQALALLTRVDPAIARRAFTEGYVAQPVIMGHGHVLGGRVAAVLTLDFEGLTLDRGQLTPGAYGEGYVDRRHPHTYLHEALVIGSGAFRGTGVSLAGGKGFVPFGTDDPMMRPFASYPVNHHLAQILERYVAIGAVRRGPFAVEAAVFNGDEPSSAGAPPDASRFGDSWAARATVSPADLLELQASIAFVTSPEIAGGAGLDQRKWSAAARVDRAAGRVRYALIEWARTDAMLGDLRTNSFTSVLAEGSLAVRSVTVAGRYENTTRPEEVRLLDPFRTSRSPTDLGIIGITRWQVGTVAASTSRVLGRFDIAPFAEVSYSRPTEELTPSAFVPRDFYGSSSIWMASAGVRLGVGTMTHRMGRYGAGEPADRREVPHAGH